MDPRLKVLGLLIVAAIVLGACQPAPGTPQAVVVTPAQAGTPLLSASEQPASAVVTPGPAQSATTFKSKDPTTLTYFVTAEPDTLDPAYDYEAAGGTVIQNSYETLIYYDREKADQFVPQLAVQVPSQSDGSISADGKTYVFKIRTGVKFHNGDTLTPDDVAFTFQRGLLNGGLGTAQWLLFQPLLGVDAGLSGKWDITSLVDPSGALGDEPRGLPRADPVKLAAACQTVMRAIVSDTAAGTVTFHLAQAWGPFLATLANRWGSIVEKKWIGANGGWDGDCKTWQNFYAPGLSDDLKVHNQLKLSGGENGTGPYRLDHWTPGKEIVLKAFEGYWRRAPAWPGGPAGAPGLKTIVLKFTAARFANRLAFFQTGDIDFIDPDSPADWAPLAPLAGQTCDAGGACAPTANSDSPVRVFTGLQAVTRTDAFFNFDISSEGGNEFIGSGQLDGRGVPPTFFSDLHVRKAFNYCFDWAAYIAQALQGEGSQSLDVMLPGEIGYRDTDPVYSHDSAKCQSEFEESGLKGTDGRSLWDTGFRLALVTSAGNFYRQAVAQILSRNISLINPKFVVQAVSLPGPTYRTAQRANKLPLYVSGWIEDIHDPHNWVAPYGRGTFARQQSLPADLVRSFGSVIDQGVRETDPAQRALAYQQFNQAYYAAAPAILLAVPFNHHYEQRWVQGYYYNPIYSSFYFYALSKQ